MRIVFICVLVPLSFSTALAQSSEFVSCEVSTVRLPGHSITGHSIAGAFDVVSLGKFETTVEREEPVKRFYRLPATKWNVIASLDRSDESLLPEASSDSITLQLNISPGREVNIFRSVALAGSQMPLASFSVGRVSTSVKVARRTIMIMMECMKQTRR